MTPNSRAVLVDTLVHQEGLCLTPYRDTAGKITIGVGRNLTDCGISRDEALMLLNADIDACLLDLQTFPWFDELNEARQMAVVSLRFNLGAAGFRAWHQTLGYLAQGDPAAAAKQFRTNTRYFGQVGVRATWIADVLETGVITTNDVRTVTERKQES